MAGLGFALGMAGAASGVGKSILEGVEKKRADALLAMERQWQLDDRQAGYAREDQVYARGRSDDLQDYSMRRNDALSDEQRGLDRQNAKTGQIANVYESLFGTESGGNFGAQNSEGYTGRSQFGAARLADFTNALGIGRISMEQFRKDPELQQRAEEWHFNDINAKIDSDGLTQFEGAVINGVPVTRSGMVAAAHLGGFNGMKRYLESGGTYDPGDSNGTKLSGYMRTHGGLSTSTEGVWEVLADPDTPESVRDDIRTRVMPATGAAAAPEDFSRQIWVRQPDGSSIRYGYRSSDGAYTTVPGPDGKPMTQAASRSASTGTGSKAAVTVKDLSPALDLRLKRRVDAAVGEGFISFDDAEMAADAIKGEVARLISTTEGLTELEAEEMAWASMDRTETKVPAVDGWFRDTPETTTPAPWGGTFGGVSAAPAGTGEAVRYDTDATLQKARDAIAKGADRDAVIARLNQAGIDTTGL